MWWCPIDMAESKKIHFCVFQKQKQKHNKKKYIAINCMPFLKKSKSSQKQNKKNDEEACPQIEKKVQEPSSQLS